MDKITISGIELSLDIKGEILRMGGPWIGDIYTGKDLISKDCIIDNFVYQKGTNLLFFVKYHRIHNYYYFTINFYNPETKTLYEFDKEFEMLHLKEFVSDNELHVYNSFNDQVGNNYCFKLDDEEFHVVSQ